MLMLSSTSDTATTLSSKSPGFGHTSFCKCTYFSNLDLREHWGLSVQMGCTNTSLGVHPLRLHIHDQKLFFLSFQTANKNKSQRKTNLSNKRSCCLTVAHKTAHRHCTPFRASPPTQVRERGCNQDEQTSKAPMHINVAK